MYLYSDHMGVKGQCETPEHGKQTDVHTTQCMHTHAHTQNNKTPTRSTYSHTQWLPKYIAVSWHAAN